MARITVVGSFVMDAVAKMETFPEAGQTVLGDSLEFFPGGKGANQCVAIARLGGDAEMIGMLGRDANGDVFRNILQREKIRAERVFSCDTPTAVAQVQINGVGQNRICVIPAANYRFGFAELEAIDDVLRATETVVLQLELRRDVTEALIDKAHAYGVNVLLNPAPAVKLDARVLSRVTYLTPNETELGILTDMPVDTDDEVQAAAKSLLKKGVRHVVATLGGRGALIADADGCRFVAGYKVNVVDTVAAGDSFNGALAVALAEGKSLDAAVRFANAMGALTVQKKGAIPSLSTREEVDAFLLTHA